MTIHEYDNLVDDLLNAALQIEMAKRPAYTLNSADVLHNFKAVAARAGITSEQAWLVYFLKHVDAISSAAKDPSIPQAEDIGGRFADAINYLKLGYALIRERQEQAG